MKSNILKSKILGFILLLSTFYFLLSTSVFAQSIFTTGLSNSPGAVFTITNLIKLISGLACYAIRFAIIASVIALVVYGIMFLKSRGNPQEFGGAKKALTWGLVGVAVIFGVFTIILTVSSLVGYGATNYTGFNTISKIIVCP